MTPELAQQLCAPLATARLALEPLGARHAEAFFGPLQDEALYRWISMARPDDLAVMRARWGRLEARVAPDGATAWPTWALRRLDDGAWVGRVDAEIDDALVALNVGYYIFTPHWGQGHASEALAAVCTHLMAQGVHRLHATVTVGNSASARVLLKTGFRYARLLPGNDVIRGVAMDDEEYVLEAGGACS